MFHKYSFCIIFILVSIFGKYEIGISASKQVVKTDASSKIFADACQSPVFLSRYIQAGYFTRQDTLTIALILKANLHDVDCGSPDCYGADLILSMTLSPGDGQCILNSVIVQRTHFMCEDYELLLAPEDFEPHTEQYIPKKERINLNDSELKRIELRSKSGKEALILEFINFFYFEDVRPQDILRTRLQNDDDDVNDCCWGATSAQLRWLHYELQSQKKQKE